MNINSKKNKELIPITEDKIPSIVSYDIDRKSLIIGENARFIGLKGQSNIFNFKLDLALTDKQFSKDKKYWTYYLNEKNQNVTETYTAKEITVSFLKKLLKQIDLPRQIIIGEPSVRDQIWKENFRRHMREIFTELEYKSPPQFFPEPFAVFQYYNKFEKIFSATQEAENILIIDIGGGTFNSCIIRTKFDGSLSRGGATSLPIGLQAQEYGGAYLDKKLLKILINKSKNKNILWKEDPIKRAESSNIPILLIIEEGKINLSNRICKISPEARVADDLSDIKEKIIIPKGALHPDTEICEEITAEELKSAIRELWRNCWSHIIVKTVNEATEKLKRIGINLDNINKVLVAGGSSKLPFMKEEIGLVLPTLLSREHIYIGSDPGNAVAYGIACECIEQVKRNPNLSIGKIAPCLLNDLYIAFKKNRGDAYYLPIVNIDGNKNHRGHLISSPFEILKTTLSYDIILPFTPNDKIYYYFSNQPFQDDQEISHLNLTNDVFYINNFNKISKNIKLTIDIEQNGAVKPTFYLKEKGGIYRKEPRIIECNEFYIDEFLIKEGESFLGFDLGTSNSYLVKVLNTSKKEITAAEYPLFVLNKPLKEKLRNIELELKKLQDELSNNSRIIDFAKKQKLLLIYHSNKIEGNPLSKGETEALLEGNKKNIKMIKEKEALNLGNAFDWAVNNLESVIDEPAGFIRELNKIILSGIEENGGKYRNEQVNLSGMNFTPPPSTAVSGLMDELVMEIKEGKNNRSVIEFAGTIHTKLVYIHPFKDGNGRTARLYMNTLLWYYKLPGIIINYIDKQRYLDNLSISNNGDISPLIDLFIEYFSDQLQEFRDFVHEKDKHTLPEEKEKNVSDSGSSEIILDKEPDTNIGPLQKVMLKKIENIKESRNKEYILWKNLFLNYRNNFNKFINNFNSNEYYIDARLFIKLYTYDMIDYDKYIDILYNKKLSKTWFFAFDIIQERKKEKFLFLFHYLDERIINIKNLNKVSLALFRDYKNQYTKLKNEPIEIRELCLVEDKIAVLNYNNNIDYKENEYIINKILADIIDEYF